MDRARERIIGSDIVIMQLEVPLETVYHTVALCAKHAVRVILNPAPANPALDVDRIKSVAIFAPNETELETLTGQSVSTIDEVRAAAMGLLRKGLSKILVTLGEKGSFLLSTEGETLVPAFPVKSVDTTGAGDAFIGCFATWLVESGDVVKAIKAANKYAALATTRPGTQKSFVDRATFEAARG
ncbi:MAG: PfkB family carbohydrate kinase [Rectinemataceae bacterium]